MVNDMHTDNVRFFTLLKEVLKPKLIHMSVTDGATNPRLLADPCKSYGIDAGSETRLRALRLCKITKLLVVDFIRVI